VCGAAAADACGSRKTTAKPSGGTAGTTNASHSVSGVVGGVAALATSRHTEPLSRKKASHCALTAPPTTVGWPPPPAAANVSTTLALSAARRPDAVAQPSLPALLLTTEKLPPGAHAME
jgi:hypothetical protein